ncbi:hypothetical protein MBLNU230_g4533t1 [Neophaeotheca triangularis]
MPHKHTRGKTRDAKNYNLPPDEVAKPLPVKQAASKAPEDGSKKPAKKRKRANGPEDDTPQAFKRLMQYQSGKRLPSGLDNGEKPKRKKSEKSHKAPDTKPTPDKARAAAEGATAAAAPRIQPGEKMSEFSARVDQALPVSGLSRKRKSGVEGIKERRTKTEKRMHKMYDQWREEEAKRKERAEEAEEQAEEEEAELETELGGQQVSLPEGKRAKRKRMIGEQKEDDEDPWARLKLERGGPRGLHDVVQAPPEMKHVPREKFKTFKGAKVDVADVPAASGSLKRREELGEARKDVIERYRAMMRQGGGQ